MGRTRAIVTGSAIGAGALVAGAAITAGVIAVVFARAGIPPVSFTHPTLPTTSSW